jgi:hypothetical protein
VYFFDQSFFFTSTDTKRDKLVEMYGEDIFGLNKKHTQQYSKTTLAPAASLKIKSLILK